MFHYLNRSTEETGAHSMGATENASAFLRPDEAKRAPVNLGPPWNST
jgi:hypothetical protein